MQFKDLQTKVEQWAEERGIFQKGSPSKQLVKTHEEINELLKAIENNDNKERIDAIGDVMVTIIIYSKIKGISLERYHEREFSDSKIELINDLIAELLDKWTALYFSEKTSEKVSPKNLYVYDIILYLNAIANFYDVKLLDCLESAYSEIKDRKGIMKNGEFIKQ